jgi:hypothetical protein
MNPAEMPVIGTLATEWHLGTSSSLSIPSIHELTYTRHQGWDVNSLPPSTFTVSSESQQAGQHSNELDAYIMGGNTTVQEYHIPNTASEINFDRNIQHRFLDFVMKNRMLLGFVTLTSNSVEGMYAIRQAFEEDLRRHDLTPPHDDISKIFLCFRPVIGSELGSQDKDKRRVQKTKANCPFQFCSSSFTRPAGLRSEYCYLR